MSQAALKEALTKTVMGIQENPVMSRVVFEAQTALVEGVRCTGQVRNFSPITVDEPPELGGQDNGANPVELLLVSLGSCQEIMYAAMAAMMGIKLDEVKVNQYAKVFVYGAFFQARVVDDAPDAGVALCDGGHDGKIVSRLVQFLPQHEHRVPEQEGLLFQDFFRYWKPAFSCNQIQAGRQGCHRAPRSN